MDGKILLDAAYRCREDGGANIINMSGSKFCSNSAEQAALGFAREKAVPEDRSRWLRTAPAG